MNRYIAALWQKKIAQFEICPLPLPLKLLEGGKVLVVAPHPDDEILGCGGTLALLRQRACQVKVVIVTDGGAGDPLTYAGGEVVNVRRQESIEALGTIGIDDVVFLNEPDGRFRATSSFSEMLTSIIREHRPDWFFLPSILDYHRDHVAVGLAALACWEKSGGGRQAFCYEIWAPLPATHVVDITPVIEQKKAAVACYKLPLRYRNYNDAMMGLALYRGLYLPPSAEPQYAEALVAVGQKWRLRSISSTMMQLRFLLERCLVHRQNYRDEH
jgi:LmbE family N-acetylglucosaminyl deacetylase